MRQHNEWRRYDGPIGEGPKMAEPTQLGIAIDTVCNATLTWEDVREIICTGNDLCNEWGTIKMHDEGQEAYYTEVLKRFNDKKK